MDQLQRLSQECRRLTVLVDKKTNEIADLKREISGLRRAAPDVANEQWLAQKLAAHMQDCTCRAGR